MAYDAHALAAVYNFPAYDGSRCAVIGVLSFGGGLYGSVHSVTNVLSNGDVQKYWRSVVGLTDADMPTVIVKTFGTASNNTRDDNSTLENTLDVTIIGACRPGRGTVIILYIMPNGDGMTAAFRLALNTPVEIADGVKVIPDLFSVSWGHDETAIFQTEARTCDALLAAACAANVNVIVASGDDGANGGLCGWPAASPNVTAVGGTSLYCPLFAYEASTTAEYAWTGSGGGTSAYFPKPVYQSSAVPRIITRRCVPDVALNADSRTGVRVLVNDAMVVVGGTSAAAPLFAAFLARSRPGAFINPKLYSSPRESYHDIVHGDNGGYVAASGFDLVTGMGSINGVSLHAALAATAPLHFNEPVVELRVGSSATLTTTAAPSTSVITWTSSNAAILSIRDGGVLTAHAVGTARISATDAANSQRTVTRTIKALAPASASTPVSVIPTSIVVNTPTLTVMYGIANRVTVTATVLPVAAVDKRVRWQSSNPSLATVSSTGVVTGRKAGQVVITVTSVASPAVWKRVTVTVRSPAPRLYRMLFSTPQRNGKAV